MSLPRVKLPPLISIGHKNTLEKRKGKKNRKIIVSGRYCNDAVVKASQRVVTIFFSIAICLGKNLLKRFKTPSIHLLFRWIFSEKIRRSAAQSLGRSEYLIT